MDMISLQKVRQTAKASEELHEVQILALVPK